jgi:hypothetical protein
MEFMTELRIGIDIGKRHDPSAIVVAVAEYRTIDGKEATHYTVPFPKRLELETPYPKQVNELTEICRGAVKRFSESGHSSYLKQPQIFVDVTGVGDAVVDLLEPNLKNIGILHPCRFAGGDQLNRSDNGRDFRIGKSHFVSRLQVLAESRVIHLPPDLPEAKQLAQEMLDFDIDVDEASGKATYGAIRPGTHDDMVTAIGLACLLEAEPDTPRLVVSGAKKKCEWRDDNWFSEASRHHGGGGQFMGGINHRSQ